MSGNIVDGGVVLIKTGFIEDLEYLYGKLVKHPLFLINGAELSGFDKLFHQTIGGIETYDDFISAASRLTGFFCDGHTNIELPYSYDDMSINIPCYWNGDRLLLSTDYKEIERDSEIISIEDTPISDLVVRMAEWIPHENKYLVKSRMINYPYKNYHIFSRMNLQSLFGEKDRYCFSFVFKGKINTVELPIEQYNGFLDFDDTNFVHYDIAGDTAVLHLDACICNDLYEHILCELADICLAQNIKILVLDLSENMGGNSAVIDAFIKHTKTDEYRRYEMIDYSQGGAEYISRRTDIVKNERHPKCFDLEIRCNVSYNTFSSARTFAVTLIDNGIAAKITGSPTGGKPNSFGMPQRFKTPNYNLSFRVSRCLFKRPNKDGDCEIALVPDCV